MISRTDPFHPFSPVTCERDGSAALADNMADGLGRDVQADIWTPAPQVYVVVALAGLQCLYITCTKPGCPRSIQCYGDMCAKLPVRPSLREAGGSPVGKDANPST